MKARLIALLGRIGPTLATTLTSQIAAALAVILVPIALGARQADAVAIGLQTGTAGLTGVVLGVVYNIAIGRPSYRRWVSTALIASAASPLLGAVTLVLLTLGSPGAATQNAIATAPIIFFALGGSILAFGGTFAVRLACEGRSVWLAGATILPSACAIAAMLAALLLNQSNANVVSTAWASGSLLYCGAILFVASRTQRAKRMPLAELRTPVDESKAVAHTAVLSIGVLTSTVLPNVFLVALTQLPGGVVAAVFVIARIGTAFVGIGVNSILLSVYSWRSSPRAVPILARRITFLAAFSAFSFTSFQILSITSLSYVCLVAMWITLLAASAMALREMNANRLVRILGFKTVADFVVSVALAFYFFQSPSTSGFFGLYCVSQCVTLYAFAFATRKWDTGFILLLPMAASLIAIFLPLEWS